MLPLSADLWQEKFKNCQMENTTFMHPKKGCHLNFEEENDIVIYMVSFLGSLAVLPGNIISALFMDKIGRIRIIGEPQQRWSVQVGPMASSMASALLLLLGGSMLVSSACTFLLLLSFSQGAVICWQCLFYGASVAAWNGLEVISVELYPSSKRYGPKHSSCLTCCGFVILNGLYLICVCGCCRGTAFGVLNGINKFAAIIASFVFAAFIGITKIIPIFLAFAALVCGGLVALKLPETREKILS